MRRLKQEIGAITGPSDELNSQLVSGRLSNSPEQWTEAQVKTWFLKNNVNVNVYDELFPCTGSMLKQL